MKTILACLHVLTIIDKAAMHIGVGEIAQLIKCLLYTREDLSWKSQNPCEQPGPVTHAYNLSTGKAEAGGSLGFRSQ